MSITSSANQYVCSALNWTLNSKECEVAPAFAAGVCLGATAFFLVTRSETVKNVLKVGQEALVLSSVLAAPFVAGAAGIYASRYMNQIKDISSCDGRSCVGSDVGIKVSQELKTLINFAAGSAAALVAGFSTIQLGMALGRSIERIEPASKKEEEDVKELFEFKAKTLEVVGQLRSQESEKRAEGLKNLQDIAIVLGMDLPTIGKFSKLLSDIDATKESINEAIDQFLVFVDKAILDKLANEREELVEETIQSE